jgi:hypothetical protein
MDSFWLSTTAGALSAKRARASYQLTVNGYWLEGGERAGGGALEGELRTEDERQFVGSTESRATVNEKIAALRPLAY